jgi:hypothetical protein
MKLSKSENLHSRVRVISPPSNRFLGPGSRKLQKLKNSEFKSNFQNLRNYLHVSASSLHHHTPPSTRSTRSTVPGYNPRGTAGYYTVGPGWPPPRRACLPSWPGGGCSGSAGGWPLHRRLGSLGSTTRSIGSRRGSEG